MALVATFSGANVCGFSGGPFSLRWDGSTWVSQRAGCNGVETIQLSCGGSPSVFSLSIGGQSGCIYSFALTSSQCDPFKLVFSVTQVGHPPPGTETCSCCNKGTVFTVTIEPVQ
jgi:hypothetical protein